MNNHFQIEFTLLVLLFNILTMKLEIGWHVYNGPRKFGLFISLSLDWHLFRSLLREM